MTMTTSHNFAYTRDDTMETLLVKMAHLRPGRELREDFSYINLVRSECPSGQHMLTVAFSSTC
jgi:hypothetical protein